jgi:hypothetical protein
MCALISQRSYQLRDIVPMSLTLRRGMISTRLWWTILARNTISEHGELFIQLLLLSLNSDSVFSRNAGVVDEAKQVTRLVGDAKDRARDEMAGRTGETDSEMSA